MSNLRHKELFVNFPLEELPRDPIRPMDSLSTFVVAEMPELLNQIRGGEANVATLVTKAEAVANAQTLRLLKLLEQGKEEQLLVARLDILMLDAAIHNSGSDAGPILSELRDRIALHTNRLPVLTYEDVVINNPENDIRTFTNGVAGRSEAGFYNGHRYIENALQPSIDAENYVLANDEQLTTQEIIKILDAVIEGMNQNIAYTGTIYKKMPTEHFNKGFRRYFEGVRGLRGPSGAFSPRVPLLEYLLAGEVLPVSEIEYNEAQMPYFPLAHQEQLDVAIKNARAGKSINQLFARRGKPEEGKAFMRLMRELFTRFRQIHIDAVAAHIPDVYHGKEKGTGGETEVAKFLKNRFDREYGKDE